MQTVLAACKEVYNSRQKNAQQSKITPVFTKSSVSPSTIFRSPWLLSARNINIIPTNTNTNVSCLLIITLNIVFGMFLSSPNHIFAIRSWVCASQLHHSYFQECNPTTSDNGLLSCYKLGMCVWSPINMSKFTFTYIAVPNLIQSSSPFQM